MKLSTTGNPCTTSFMAKASKPGNMPQHSDFEVMHTFYYIQFQDGFMLMDYNQIGMKNVLTPPAEKYCHILKKYFVKMHTPPKTASRLAVFGDECIFTKFILK